MTRYLVSFDDGSMDHIRDEDLPEVNKATHAVMREAVDAGVFVTGGGADRRKASIVATDGTVTDGPDPETKTVIGGFVVIDVPSPEEALTWAAKFASACRCAQEVREIMPDPELDAILAVPAGGSSTAR
ncbi:YciI family protein [Micromonospora sp. NPDC047812]|uniref:YciI family protein n=1 Tax=Micromonospora sp. NPDC047812 TaxID=3155742 RepID=UPI00345341E7